MTNLNLEIMKIIIFLHQNYEDFDQIMTCFR